MDAQREGLIAPDDPRLEGLVIRIADMRRCGYCVAGVRRWFGEKDLDFKAFLSEGLPATTLAATADGCAEKVLRRKLSGADG